MLSYSSALACAKELYNTLRSSINALAAGAKPQTPLRELTTLLHTPSRLERGTLPRSRQSAPFFLGLLLATLPKVSTVLKRDSLYSTSRKIFRAWDA
jgi:hypothetical protein